MSGMIFFLTIVLFIQQAHGEFICDELPVSMCSFSVSSSGKRCLLETSVMGGQLQCKTSEIIATNRQEHVESEECVTACGVDMNSAGISSDSLLDPQLTHKLCATQCYNNCPNIVDLYNNLALAEGVSLDELCKSYTESSRRSAIQLQSSAAASGRVADSPFSSAAYAPMEAHVRVDCAPSPL